MLYFYHKWKKKTVTTNSFLIFCVKVNGKVVSAHAVKVYGKSRSIGPLILNSGSRERREVKFTPHPPYPWAKYFWSPELVETI
jgi:hypothetical protein